MINQDFSIYTVEERDLLRDEVQYLQKCLSEGNFEKGKDAVRVRTLHVLGEDRIKDTAALDELLKELDALSVLTLVVARSLPQKEVHKLFEWGIKNIDESIVLCISVDPTIIAGAEIEYRGKYCDVSVRKRFENRIEKISNQVQSVVL